MSFAKNVSYIFTPLFVSLFIRFRYLFVCYNNYKKKSMVPAQHNQPLNQQAEALYEQYGKPLEAQHTGKYVAISQDGKTAIGSSVFMVMQKAKEQFGPGNFIFKIGERSVGKWL
jgi:hypothetical protein